MVVRIGAKTKGAGIRSWSQYVDERFGAGTMAGIVETMPTELRASWPDILPNAWYPSDFLAHAWTAIAREKLGGDSKRAVEFFPALGRHIAEDNLSTIYRFLLSLMSPYRILGMTPRLWTTYFDTASVEVQHVPGAVEGKAIVKGIGPVPYLGLVAKGWLELAYEKCGAKEYEVDEEGFREGRIAADPMVFVHRWR